MNNLNSTLIEGKITDGPCKDGRFVYFTIASSRRGADKKTEKTHIIIRVEADMLQERALAVGTVGRGVRIVGRLCWDHGLVVAAEHIEYRPEPNKEVGF